MAGYEKLPIYKKSLDLTVYFENIVRSFSRYHKYTVGTDLRNISKDITLKCVMAIKAHDKERLNILHDISGKLEELKVTVRICRELQAFKSFNSFEYSIKQTEDIARQTTGWIKKQTNRQTPQ